MEDGLALLGGTLALAVHLLVCMRILPFVPLKRPEPNLIDATRVMLHSIMEVDKALPTGH